MAKLSQNSPLAAKAGGGKKKKWKTKTKQQAHSPSPAVPPNYAATSPGKVHAPAPRPHARAGERQPRRAPPHTPASAGVRLRVYLLQLSPTLRHSSCGAPPNPTTSRPAGCRSPVAGAPGEAARLLHPGDCCTGFLPQPEVGSRLPCPMTPRARRGGEDPAAGPGVGAGLGAGKNGEGERRERAGRSPEGGSRSAPAPFKCGSHVQIKFRLISRPPPERLAQGEAELHAAWARVASHWAVAAVSHREDDMTDTKLLRHSLDWQLP